MRGPMNAKSVSIKGAGCKFGGCVRKAVELTWGDLPLARYSGDRESVLDRAGRAWLVRGADEMKTSARRGTGALSMREPAAVGFRCWAIAWNRSKTFLLY